MGLIHRLGGGFGSSFRLGIGCSVTAEQNEITAKRSVSGYRAHFSRRSSSILTRDVRRNSSGSTIVAMMQTTQPWHRCHLVTDAGSFPCFTTRRRSLFEREMCAILEIVADVFVHQAFQMPLIENDHVVEQIPAAGAYPAFRNTVLPWTSEARPLWPVPRQNSIRTENELASRTRRCF